MDAPVRQQVRPEDLRAAPNPQGGAAAAPLVEVRDVGKCFGEFTALHEVSLAIPQGEFVCFLGPSGCGKTTLLRMLAGLESVSRGTILFGGRDVTRLSTMHRDIGIVFQSYALFPNLTVTENIAYGLKSRGASKQERRERVRELVALIRLEGSEDKYPYQLSGGEQQRVAVARALAVSPALLLLDEPLSALDARVRLHLRLQLKDIHRRFKLTTIMVTHDQEEALVLADRIVLMNAGRVEQAGSPYEIYSTPRSEFVANFVGSMNLLPAQVAQSGAIAFGSDGRYVVPGLGTGEPAGTSALVCIRPEHVGVGAAAGQGLRMKGVIVESEFLGANERIHVKVEGLDKPLMANHDARHARANGLGIGSTVVLAVPHDCVSLVGSAHGRGE